MGPIRGVATDPTYLDVILPAGARFEQPIDTHHSAFLYPYEGRIDVGPKNGAARPLNAHSAGVLTSGDRIEVTAGPQGARFLVLAGRPLNEPVVQYGPFVMNTREEIEQAVRDFQSGAAAHQNLDTPPEPRPTPSAWHSLSLIFRKCLELAPC